MSTRRLFLLAAIGLMAVSVLGADVTGKWKSESPGRDGTPMTTNYAFNADGGKLTGTVSGRGGDAPITEGKINGDDISFAVVRTVQGEERKIQYKGKVSGDEIKLSITFNADMPAREVVARRVKE